MRTFGIAVLGLLIGLVAGALLTSAVARPLVGTDGGGVSVGAGLFLGFLMPALGVAGAVAAVLIDRNARGTK